MTLIQIPLLRGVYEIEPILDLCDEFDAHVYGGYARYCCSKNRNVAPAGDVDIFFERPESYDLLKNKLIGFGFTIRHENDISLTFNKSIITPYDRCPTIQLIKPFKNEGTIVTVGLMEEILEQFDFSVVAIAINKDRKTATTCPEFEEDENNKTLRIFKIHCPISSLMRCCKYAKKGYWLKPSEAIKLFEDWGQRNEGYKSRISELFQFSKDADHEMTQEEVDELERMLRVD